ncbi:MAG: HK97 family phage prohead protease [Synergistota bacterium]|nr:HK97 family phage prohead protease [Synergistota bacterium]
MGRVLERRAITELRSVESETPALEGYAALFDTLSEELWGFRERIAKGAFAKTIKADDIRFLFNHNADHVLGRNRAKTLSLNEDDQGLKFRVDLPGTQFAGDLAESVKRGDIDQCSFGFYVVTDNWKKENGVIVRTLEEVELFDVSLVTYPAYKDTSASVRSAQTLFQEKIQELEAPAMEAEAQSRILVLKRRLDLLENEI